MSELISGKEALIAIANGQEVEWKHTKHKCVWSQIRDDIYISTFKRLLIDDGDIIFRLKPRTITINGIEVPKPDYIQHGRVGAECSGWYIDIGGTYFLYKNRKDYDAVVAALRSIFNPK